MGSTGASRKHGLLRRLTLVLAVLLAGLLVVRQIGFKADPAPAGSSPVLGYIGDSLTVDQGEAVIATDLFSLGFSATNLKVDGLEGRSISEAEAPWPSPGSTDVVNTWRTVENFHPDVWVVALIANDFDQDKDGIKARIDILLAVLDDEPVNRVLWVGPVVRPGSALQSAVDTNLIPALQETATEKAGAIDFRFFDLQSAMRGLGLNEESPELWSDDRHMTPAGSDLRRSLIHAFIGANLPSPSATVKSGIGVLQGRQGNYRKRPLTLGRRQKALRRSGVVGDH